jgi:alpha/beta superfamily hydrolase
LLIHGDADDVVPVKPVLEWCAKLPIPPKVVLLPGVGHFFHGRLADLTRAVTEQFGAELARGGSDAA